MICHIRITFKTVEIYVQNAGNAQDEVRKNTALPLQEEADQVAETIKEDELNKIEINNEDVINKQENIIKNWSKGKELTLAAKAFVYSQEDSKLHEGEKIDYWTPQKNSETQEDLEVLKGQTVKYTGNYSKSVDKMTNEGLIYVEIEKDEIKGYIKCKFIQNSSEPGLY